MKTFAFDSTFPRNTLKRPLTLALGFLPAPRSGVQTLSQKRTDSLELRQAVILRGPAVRRAPVHHYHSSVLYGARVFALDGCNENFNFNAALLAHRTGEQSRIEFKLSGTRFVGKEDDIFTEAGGHTPAPGSVLQADSRLVPFHVVSSRATVVGHSAHAVGRNLCR